MLDCLPTWLAYFSFFFFLLLYICFLWFGFHHCTMFSFRRVQPSLKSVCFGRNMQKLVRVYVLVDFSLCVGYFLFKFIMIQSSNLQTTSCNFCISYCPIWEMFPWEIRVAFLEEHQLSQSLGTDPKVIPGVGIYNCIPGQLYPSCRGIFNVRTPVAHSRLPPFFVLTTGLNTEPTTLPHWH